MGSMTGDLGFDPYDERFEGIGLLEGIPREKQRSVLRCLHTSCIELAAGESLLANVPPQASRYLVSGVALVQRLDEDGNRSILCVYKEGSVVAGELPRGLFMQEDIDVVAAQPCLVLDFCINEEVEACTCCVKYVNQIRGNVIRALNSMSALLLSYMTVLSGRTIRDKIMAYLKLLAQQQGSSEFTLLFNRQELADFLQVNRSALSRELSTLRAEGVIDFNKNEFKLLQQ
ncbi:MAG: Crp/Fnr family transcriptional regulator [Coriobacteriales bacterium]